MYTHGLCRYWAHSATCSVDTSVWGWCHLAPILNWSCVPPVCEIQIRLHTGKTSLTRSLQPGITEDRLRQGRPSTAWQITFFPPQTAGFSTNQLRLSSSLMETMVVASIPGSRWRLWLRSTPLWRPTPLAWDLISGQAEWQSCKGQTTHSTSSMWRMLMNWRGWWMLFLG